jgi:c-di-GMP-binding flagellar brake protein YcgR
VIEVFLTSGTVGREKRALVHIRWLGSGSGSATICGMDKSLAEESLESHEFLTADLAESQRVAHLQERRAGRRMSIGIRAKITVPGKSVLPAHTVDLARGGASITLPFQLAFGQKCLIDLELAACGMTSVFHIPAEVRYCVQMGNARFRAGLRFGDLDAGTDALIAAALGIHPH